MHDGGGKAIITAGESKLLAGLLDKYGIGHSIPAGLVPDINYPGPNISKSSMERITIAGGIHQQQAPGQVLDSEKIGRAMAKHIAMAAHELAK